MPITHNRTVNALIGEQHFIGKAITMIAVDWDVNADASRKAMEAVRNTLPSGTKNIAAGTVQEH